MKKNKKDQEARNTVRLILDSLVETSNESMILNESTLKHYFFYHLKKRNPKHNIVAEDKYKKYINFKGKLKKEWEADFFLHQIKKSNTKTHLNNIAIEFKIDSKNKLQIKNDFYKLNKLKSSNPKLTAIFINFFTSELNFLKYLDIIKIFNQRNIYAITIAQKGIFNYTYENENCVLSYDIKEFALITNYDNIKGHYNFEIKKSEFPEILVPGLNNRKKIRLEHGLDICLDYYHKIKKYNY